MWWCGKGGYFSKIRLSCLQELARLLFSWIWTTWGDKDSKFDVSISSTTVISSHKAQFTNLQSCSITASFECRQTGDVVRSHESSGVTWASVGWRTWSVGDESGMTFLKTLHQGNQTEQPSYNWLLFWCQHTLFEDLLFKQQPQKRRKKMLLSSEISVLVGLESYYHYFFKFLIFCFGAFSIIFLKK